ncbi:unnamed protein product [Vitrella brassicaformis CCMP3155]|uniref:CRAL-TRIO domain-containing protein n=1 Tax=Vitrella brassicaformis (strain CCMP3155) TaxID=1169540 RepID=A0A0G4EY34_VITBC|nr:unnamed protein product [Vitrella brassicaformis CCMP3155]|mmetsp:Transcript_47936/g.119938  ORF Transcript_47936/g.119938 Transcript_47936/m.119938 type:complete len:488 (-) Transcript_47936:26-1489(-)|eukprot:CEM03539.1 unnamed protein product [Vitrella brassicaformis CCMP3155]
MQSSGAGEDTASGEGGGGSPNKNQETVARPVMHQSEGHQDQDQDDASSAPPLPPPADDAGPAPSCAAPPSGGGGGALASLADVTEEDIINVANMKHRLADVLSQLPEFPELKGDIRLLRFLRGYMNNLDDAESAYRAHIEWREQNGVDEIRQDVAARIGCPEEVPGYQEVVKYLPLNQALRDEKGEYLRDKKGNLLAIDRYGEWDISSVLTNVPDSVFDKWHIYSMELRSVTLDRLSRAERRVVKVTLIQDMAGLSIRQISRQALKLAQKTMGTARDNYPEGVAKILIINTPWMFSTFWKGISRWMRPRTLEKVAILGSEFEQTVFESVDSANLPPFLGGTSTSPLADVPKTGLLEEDRFALGSGKITAEIAAGKKLQVPYQVRSGHTIYWAWGVMAMDVGFTINMRTTVPGSMSVEEKALLNYARHSSERALRGSLTFASDGIVTFVWDNTFSFLRAKQIAYKIEVVRPEDTEQLAQNLREEFNNS